MGTLTPLASVVAAGLALKVETVPLEPENGVLVEARDPLELLAKAPKLNMFPAGEDVNDAGTQAVLGAPFNARLLSSALSDSAGFTM